MENGEVVSGSAMAPLNSFSDLAVYTLTISLSLPFGSKLQCTLSLAVQKAWPDMLND